MNLLIVEDDADFLEEIQQVVRSVVQDADIKIAASRNSAIALIEKEFFDFVVLDLNIPTEEGALDGEPEHGYSVLTKARSVARGTPIFVLTGSPAEQFISDLMQMPEKVDVWGEGHEIPTIAFLPKHKLDHFPTRIAPYLTSASKIFEVEIERGKLKLTKEQDRLIRIFSRAVSGTRCVISQLGGGLSGTEVFRLRVTNAGGVLVHDAVSKIGDLEEVRDENTRFDTHIARLHPSATPRKLMVLEHGAKNIAGVFYGLADGFVSHAFSVATDINQAAISTCVEHIEELTARWGKGGQQSRMKIRELRQRCIGDEAFASVRSKIPLTWIEQFESNEIQVHWCCVHGDLHGLNVLVSESGIPILIDYGDVAEGPRSLDPITLEFSLFFHPEGPLRTSEWPSRKQALVWSDIDAYLDGCPVPTFVRACRRWAEKSAVGKREICSVAYSYLVRQLKYEGVNVSLILDFLEGIKTFYDEQT